MRILLSSEDKKYLFNYLKEKNKCSSYMELADKIDVPFNTLQTWIYEKDRYLPERIIPAQIINKLKIIEKREDNWGSVKGGKKTYQIIIRKYGIEEIKRRQLNGGKKTMRNHQREEPIKININDPLFLEFYGALIGDGWLSKLRYKNKIINLIGVSGHRVLDKEFLILCKKRVNKLFNRKAYLKEIVKHNGIELLFSHKGLLKFLNEELNFSIGKKIGLKIREDIINKGFDSVKYIIRGIFDTDGSFYFDKTPAKKPYPCISITMKQPILMRQIYNVLIKEGFKVTYSIGKENRKDIEKITLKGSIQLNKWMRTIGSSNSKHLNKIAKIVPVAQLDSAAHS